MARQEKPGRVINNSRNNNSGYNSGGNNSSSNNRNTNSSNNSNHHRGGGRRENKIEFSSDTSVVETLDSRLLTSDYNSGRVMGDNY